MPDSAAIRADQLRYGREMTRRERQPSPPPPPEPELEEAEEDQEEDQDENENESGGACAGVPPTTTPPTPATAAPTPSPIADVASLKAVPAPLQSLARKCNAQTRTRLADVDLSKDWLRIRCMTSPGQVAQTIQPVPLTFATDGGMLEEIESWFNQPWYRLEFLMHECDEEPYLVILHKRTGPAAAAGDPPPVQLAADPLQQQIGLLADGIAAILEQNQHKRSDPMAALAERLLNVMTEGYAKYLERQIESLSAPAAPAAPAANNSARGQLAVLLKELKTAKTEARELLELTGEAGDEDDDEGGDLPTLINTVVDAIREIRRQPTEAAPEGVALKALAS